MERGMQRRRVEVGTVGLLTCTVWLLPLRTPPPPRFPLHALFPHPIGTVVHACCEPGGATGEGVVNGKGMSIVCEVGRMRRMMGEDLLGVELAYGGTTEAGRGGGRMLPLLLGEGVWGGARRGNP